MACWSLSAENGSGLNEEECFPHQQSLLSPSLKVVACAVSETSRKVPIDLMGTSQAFQTTRNSRTDENM